MGEIRLYILFILSSFCLTLRAQTISVETAMSSASRFLEREVAAKHRNQSQIGELRLAYTAKEGDETYFYVFNETDDDGGFIITGADEAAAEILSYAEVGSFEYAKASEILKWWLTQYVSQIHCAIRDVKEGRKRILTPEELRMTAHNKTARRSVGKLIKSKWDQIAPYNMAIPSSDNHTFTGCVATAMAQVMNYYKHPQKGKGRHTCTDKSGHTYTADYENTTYDWTNTINSYTAPYTPQQAQAVAQLMYHCGVSVNTKYSRDASVADIRQVPMALSTYFGYDKSGEFHSRANYTDDQWDELIYNELKNNRPVLYCDDSGRQGHTFVCSGYNASNGLYAFNWGWGGVADGFYAVTATKVADTGSKATRRAVQTDEYTLSQTILCNIMPDRGGKPAVKMQTVQDYRLLDNTKVIYSYTDDRAKSRGKTLRLACSFMNASPVTTHFYVGAMLKEQTTGLEYIIDDKTMYALKPLRYYTHEFNVPFNTSRIKYNGTYDVYPAYRLEGDTKWHRVLYTVDSQQVPSVTLLNATPSNLPLQRSVQAESRTGIETQSGIIPAPTAAHTLSFGISTTSLKWNETALIHCTANDYNGMTAYTTSDPSVATVSEDGLVSARGEGTATITVVAEHDDLYTDTETSFVITVTSDIPTANGLMIARQPKIGTHGYVTTDDNKIQISVINNSFRRLIYPQIYYRYTIGDTLWYGHSGHDFMPPNDTGTCIIEMHDLPKCKDGQTITIELFLDEQHTIPCNIPSLLVPFVSEK